MNSYAHLFENAVLRIPNASRLTAKLITLEPGKDIDVKFAELPPSYRTIGSLLGRLRRDRGMYFVAFDLKDGTGWKILKLKDLETLKQFYNLVSQQKTKTMIEEMPKRTYNLSDAVLVQVVDARIIFATRDIADLEPRGVTPARLEALQEANDAFKEMPTDDWWEGQESLKVESRNIARNLLESKLGNLRTMAQNVWGDKSVKYGSYKFEGMTGLEDAKLSEFARGAHKQATDDAAALLAEGCTPAFLTALKDLAKDLDDKIDVVKNTKADRHIAVKTRTDAGNDIYKEVDRICNTGKDVYRETNPAKYGNYIIYNTPTGGSGISITRELELSGAMPGNLPIADVIFTSHTQVLAEITNNAMQAYGGATPAAVYNTGDPLLDLAIGNEDFSPAEFAAATGLGTIGDFLMVRLVGVGPGHIKITFTNVAE